jgi:hypothetical protein
MRQLRFALPIGLLLAGAAWAEEASCPARAAAAARAAYKGLDYSTAANATRDVETCLDGTPAELAEALRWRGQALAAVGDSVDAVRAFSLLATVSPEYALDPFLSPKVHQLFQTGRAQAKLRGTLFARVIAPELHGGVELARAEVYGTPGKVTFRFQVIRTSVDVPGKAGPGSYAAPVPAGASGPFSVLIQSAEDASQITRVEAPPTLLSDAVFAQPEPPRPAAAPTAAVPSATPVEVRRDNRVHSKAWIPAAAGVAVAVVGVACLAHGNDIANAVSDPTSSTAQNIHASSNPQTALNSTLSTASAFQTLGVIGFIAGGGLLATGTVLFLSDKPVDSEPTLSFFTDGHGAGASVRGRF